MDTTLFVVIDIEGMNEHSNVNAVPAKMKSTFESIVDATDEFCETHLNNEYAKLSKELAAALSRKRPSPLLKGKINTWACGIVYALGYVRLLVDDEVVMRRRFQRSPMICPCVRILCDRRAPLL